MHQHSAYRAVAALAILVTLALTACGQAASTGRTIATPATSAAANAPTEPPAATAGAATAPTQAAQGNAMTTPSGLQYIELAAGSGAAPKAGDTVSVHYTGTLTDGTVFDSECDSGYTTRLKNKCSFSWSPEAALPLLGQCSRNNSCTITGFRVRWLA